MHAFASIMVHVDFPVISNFYELAKMRTQKMDSKIHPQETLGHSSCSLQMLGHSYALSLSHCHRQEQSFLLLVFPP